MTKNFNLRIKLILIVFALLLCASVTINIIQYHIMTEDSRQNIVGTYATGAENEFPSEDDEYIIFDNEGTYMRYRQFEIFDKGTYKKSNENVVTLVSQDATTYAFWQGKQLFYTGSNNGSFIFKKIDDMPVKINV